MSAAWQALTAQREAVCNDMDGLMGNLHFVRKKGDWVSKNLNALQNFVSPNSAAARHNVEIPLGFFIKMASFGQMSKLFVSHLHIFSQFCARLAEFSKRLAEFSAVLVEISKRLADFPPKHCRFSEVWIKKCPSLLHGDGNGINLLTGSL